MLISVIVPTFNDAANLPVMLRELSAHHDVELIVVDGGSTDHSVFVAEQFTSYVFITHRNRAAQKNFGARHATGDVLLFLHPDTFLLSGAVEEIQRRLIGSGAVGGAFDLHLDSPRRSMKWLERLASRGARLWRRPRGEQGVFVWRQVFEALDGFPDVTIFEDVAFARRLRRAGLLTFIPHGLVASARRWQSHGVLKILLVNWTLAVLFFLRVSPVTLRKLYDRWLPVLPVRRVKTDRSTRPKISAG
jgi:rSAM/selenodomain-associated transferase 2